MKPALRPLVILHLSLAGLGTSPAAAEEATGFDLATIWPFTLFVMPPAVLQQEAYTQAKTKWLDGHKLTREISLEESLPKPAETCSGKHQKMTGDPILSFPDALAEAYRRSPQRPWSFVRYDIVSDRKADNAAAVDSSGDPDYDTAAVAAMASARFELLNGVELAQGCIAYFVGGSYVGIAPKRDAGHPKRKPRLVRFHLNPKAGGGSPDQGAPTVPRSRTGDGEAGSWWYTKRPDQADDPQSLPSSGLNCATLADRLTRPVQCER